MKNKHEKAVITVKFSTLARITGEDALRAILKAKGKRKGSSIIIAADIILPILEQKKNDDNTRNRRISKSH